MGGQLTNVDLTLNTELPRFTPGALYIAEDGRFYEYAKSEGAASAGHFCIIDESGDAIKADNDTHTAVAYKLGVACVDMTDEYYGWYWRGNGVFEAIIGNSVSALSALTLTGTGGEPGTGGTLKLDGVTNIDAGVTSTRVTCYAPGLMTVGVAVLYD